MPGNRIRVKAAKLRQKRVFIVSYTDSEGAYEYNFDLSKRPRTARNIALPEQTR